MRLSAPPRAPVGPTAPRIVDRLRRRKRMSPIAIDRSRFLRSDIERAEQYANGGNLQLAAQIADWCKGHLVSGGLFNTRCSVPRLPREWTGDEEARAWLEGGAVEALAGDVRRKRSGAFDRIFQPSELKEMFIDHLNLGAGVAMFVKPDGAALPVLVSLDPQYLQYLPGEDRYRYQGYNAVHDVTPGDGVWVLHRNGIQDPWRNGIWSELAHERVSDGAAGLHRDAFIHRFGNPLTVAVFPSGAEGGEKISYVNSLVNFGLSILGVSPGYDVKTVQPKAEGREVFADVEARYERRAQLRIAGQTVTSNGGPGFTNAEMFERVHSYLIADTAGDGCTTLNEQAFPPLLHWRYGRDVDLSLAYDVTPPQARKAKADALLAAMVAYEKMRANGFVPDGAAFREEFKLPVVKLPSAEDAKAQEAIFGYHIEQLAVTLPQIRSRLGLTCTDEEAREWWELQKSRFLKSGGGSNAAP